VEHAVGQTVRHDCELDPTRTPQLRNPCLLGRADQNPDKSVADSGILATPVGSCNCLFCSFVCLFLKEEKRMYKNNKMRKKMSGMATVSVKRPPQILN
jgi:hypothetical protein